MICIQILFQVYSSVLLKIFCSIAKNLLTCVKAKALMSGFGEIASGLDKSQCLQKWSQNQVQHFCSNLMDERAHKAQKMQKAG